VILHYTDVVRLDSLPELLRAKLAPLTLPGMRLRGRLAMPEGVLVVVALDHQGPCGWAAISRDGFIDVFVAPRSRRQGIGQGLITMLVPEARREWPDLDIRYQVEKGTPGFHFWRAMEQTMGGPR